jgi:hypothetical protein
LLSATRLRWPIRQERSRSPQKDETADWPIHGAEHEISPKAGRGDAWAEWAIRLEERHYEGHRDKHEAARVTDAVAIDDGRVAIGDGMAPEATPRPDAEDERGARTDREYREGDRGGQHSGELSEEVRA